MACVFCGGAGPFDTQEHIIPPQLAGDLLVVPAGTVCDACNHYFGHATDEYFYNTDLIFTRAMLGWPTRKLKSTRLSGQGYSIVMDEPLGHHLTITHGESADLHLHINQDEHLVKITYSPGGSFKPYLTSSYLSKVLVEFAHWQNAHRNLIDTSRPIPISEEFNRNARFPSPNAYIPFAHRSDPALGHTILLGMPTYANHNVFRLVIAGRDFLLPVPPQDSLDWATYLGYSLQRPRRLVT